jgi:hypothetical protein
VEHVEPTLFDVDPPPPQPVTAVPPQPRTGWYKLTRDPEQYCDHCTTLFIHGGRTGPRRLACWLRISTDHRSRLMLCDGHADLIRAGVREIT